MDSYLGGRLIAGAFSVLVAGILASVLGVVVLPGGDKCHDTSIIVWSSTEPGLARADPDSGLGALQRAAQQYSCITVKAISSGFAQQAIADALERGSMAELPDVWLPTHSFWNSLLDEHTGRFDDSLGSFTSSRMRLYVKFNTPLATELGGRGSVTWRDLAGQASAGRLDLVKENALNSTSGAMATILAFEAAAGGGTGVSADDVRTGQLDALAAPIERSVASYPGEIVDYLSSFKPPIDTTALPGAMIIEEAVYEGFPELTQHYRPVNLAGPDPTLDHPYLLRPQLDKHKMDLAKAFHKTLTSDKWQKEFDQAGFETGTGPGLTRRDGAVVEAILERWRETLRKRISLAITLDQSGSTEPYKRQVAEAMTSALRSLSATDRVAFFGFPGAQGAVYEPLSAGGFGDPTKISVPDVPNRGGSSPVIEAVRETADLVRDEQGEDANNPRKQAVIVITDGEQAGAGSAREQQRDTERIRRYRENGVQVFFVLVGSKPLCSVDRIYSTISSDCRNPGNRPAKLDQDERRWVYCISDRPDCPTPLPSQQGKSSDEHIRAIVKQIFDQLGGAPI
nr:vWA domain-containing protein [Actinoplanes ovalisporus]